MKTVHLKTIIQRGKSHEVFLGNGTRNAFANKKEAKKFLADTNRFLTKKLIDLNEIYYRAFVEYRQIWFLLYNVKQGKKTNYREDEKTIKAGLDAVEHFFDKIASSFSSTDYTVFIDAKKICLYLSEVLKCLVELNKRRNNTVAYYTLENLLSRVTTLANEINGYSKQVLENDEAQKNQP